MDVTASGPTLVVGDETVTFDYPVGRVLEVDDRILVLLAERGHSDWPPSDNIIAFDTEGNQLWRIDEPPSSSQWYLTLEEDDEEGRILAENYDSWVYEIDLETGAVEARYWVR